MMNWSNRLIYSVVLFLTISHERGIAHLYELTVCFGARADEDSEKGLSVDGLSEHRVKCITSLASPSSASPEEVAPLPDGWTQLSNPSVETGIHASADWEDIRRDLDEATRRLQEAIRSGNDRRAALEAADTISRVTSRRRCARVPRDVANSALELAQSLCVCSDVLSESTIQAVLDVGDRALAIPETDTHANSPEGIARLLMAQGTLAKTSGDYDRAEQAFMRVIVTQNWRGYEDGFLAMGYDRLFRTYLLQGKKEMARWCLESMKGFFLDDDLYNIRKEMIDDDSWRKNEDLFREY